MLRVLELGEDLPLETEALAQLQSRPYAVHHGATFSATVLRYSSIVAHRFEDEAHAAAADLAHEPIGAEVPAGPSRRAARTLAATSLIALAIRSARAGGVRQHAAQLAGERLVIGCLARDERLLLERRQIQRGDEERVQPAPGFRGEVVGQRRRLRYGNRARRCHAGDPP